MRASNAVAVAFAASLTVDEMPPALAPEPMLVSDIDEAMIRAVTRRFAANAHPHVRAKVLEVAACGLRAAHARHGVDLLALYEAKAPVFRGAVVSIIRNVNPATGELLKGFAVPLKEVE